MTDDWLRKTARPVNITRVDATAPNLARVWNYMVGGAVGRKPLIFVLGQSFATRDP